MNAKKVKALMGQPKEVAVSLRPPPVNPFTRRNNEGKVVMNLFIRNGGKSFVNYKTHLYINYKIWEP